MKDFQREIRYTVLKYNDVHEALDEEETQMLIQLEEKIAAYRTSVGKEPLECVVVEKDWGSCYSDTWNLIMNYVEVSK